MMATARGSTLSRSLDLSPLRRPSPLPNNILPSKGDVIRFAKHLQTEAGKDKTDENGRMVKGRDVRNYPLGNLATDVAEELVSVWTSCVSQFVPPITHDFKLVQGNVKRLLERARITSHRLQATDERIVRVFQESKDLFDIINCK